VRPEQDLRFMTESPTAQNRPARAILVLRLPDGSRTMANGPANGDFCAALLAREPIGRAGLVKHDPATQTNRFVFAD
jgi:hypothetical protein